MLFSNYSFNNQEHDDEIFGDGNAISFDARMLDSRLGRWFSLDPKASHYPEFSPYAFAENRPIELIDLNGEGGDKKDPPKSNILIIVPSAKEISEKKYEGVGGNQGNWYVIVANSYTEALTETKKYLGTTKAKNIEVDTHGALVKGTLMIKQGKPASGTVSGEADELITATSIDGYNAGKIKAGNTKKQIAAIKGLAGLTEEGGNFIINSCLSGCGPEGKKLAAGIKKLVGNKVNLYMSEAVTEGKTKQESNGFMWVPKIKMDIPIIITGRKYYDDFGNNHENKSNEQFITVDKNGNSKDVGNLILHEKGDKAVEFKPMETKKAIKN